MFTRNVPNHPASTWDLNILHFYTYREKGTYGNVNYSNQTSLKMSKSEAALYVASVWGAPHSFLVARQATGDLLTKLIAFESTP